jgi:pentapeptide repeat protein
MPQTVGIRKRRRRRAFIVCAVLLAVAGLAVCVVFGPVWLTGADLTPMQRLSAENNVRSTLLSGLVGLLALGGVALGAWVTFGQVRASREGNTIGLYIKAIELLASDDASVRMGGVYAMEMLCGLDGDYCGQVGALLTTFVRSHAPWPPTKPEAEVDAERARFTGGAADDVGAALAALSRGSIILKGERAELERVDLRGAELQERKFPLLCLAHSNLEGANLAGAKLYHATLIDTVLRKANLSRADLREADLTGADLEGAVLLGADLTDAIWPPTVTVPAGWEQDSRSARLSRVDEEPDRPSARVHSPT